MCAGMSQRRGVLDAEGKLYYAQNSGRFTDHKTTNERSDVNRSMMREVRKEQETVDSGGRLRVAARSFGLSNGDTIEGEIASSIRSHSLHDATVPLLQGRRHKTKEVTVSLALPPAVALRDAYFIQRMRVLFAAAAQSMPESLHRPGQSTSSAAPAEPPAKKSRVDEQSAASTTAASTTRHGSASAALPWGIADLKSDLKRGL